MSFRALITGEADSSPEVTTFPTTQKKTPKNESINPLIKLLA